jgi:hypothetical protein
MNTFSSDYISQPMGITSNIVRGLSRDIEVPIKKYKVMAKDAKTLKEIKKTLSLLVDLLLKIN